MKYLRLLWDFIKPSPGSSLNQKTLILACFLTFLCSLLGLSINLILKMPVLVIEINSVMVVIYLILYLQSRRNYSLLIALLYVYLSLLILSLIWFPNGGLLGSTPIFYIAVLTLAFFVLPRKQALLFMSSAIVSLLALYLIEWCYPAIAIPYSK